MALPDADLVPERVALLDPLCADDVCARLPEMNARRDAGAIARALSELVPSGPVLSSLSYDGCLAAMRDLGVFLGSLKRHGVEPVDAVPGLEPVLVELGRRTGMVPRDTIHHFTELNPTGARQRLYTGDPMESLALDTVRIPLRHFATAMSLGERLAGAVPWDAEFAVLLNDMADALGGFDAGMRLAQDKLEPAFFFDEFLPYTADIEVGGARYPGPTAAHVPLGVIDTLVWESDHGSSDVAEYRRERLPYTMPRWRALHSRWAATPSLTTRVSAAIATATGAGAAAVRDSATELIAVLRVLVAFRGKHVAYARKGFDDERLDLLRSILDGTRWQAAGLAERSGGVDDEEQVRAGSGTPDLARAAE